MRSKKPHDLGRRRGSGGKDEEGKGVKRRGGVRKSHGLGRRRG